MAEPVGITGTALGVISLGLQVYGNLKTYVDDFKDRDERIAKVSHNLESLHASLNVIRTALPATENSFNSESAVVAACLDDCEAGLRSLTDFIQTHDAAPRTNLKEKAREAKKKLKFPFAVPHIEKLASDIDRINGNLRIAVQGLGLYVLGNAHLVSSSISPSLSLN